MIRHPLSFLGGVLAGICAMYYLDAQSGRRRRALVRDKFVAAGHDAADYAQAKGKRAMDRARGMVATHSLHGGTRRAPESDEQLQDRIRSRLGHRVSHPKAVEVHVEHGSVRLGGHVLRKEADALCREVQSMAGVRELRNELQLHDAPEGIPSLQGRQDPSVREGQPAGTTWH